MKHIPIVSIQMVREGSVKYETKQVTNAVIGAGIMRELIGDKDREHFIVIGLDVKLFINHISIVHIGAVSESLVSPREVFKTAILSNSSNIIVGHNHPTGDPAPSGEDRHITHRIKECGELLGIIMRDHIILGRNKFFSFKSEEYFRF